MSAVLRARLGIAAALAGASTMVVELAAVRLVAPYFGASLVVWTNVIGVVLFALAVGYVVGARLARAARPTRPLTLALVLAAAATAWLVSLAPVACRWFLPEGLALHEAFGLLAWGSLATTLVLFAPVALALGTVSPLVVEVWQRASHESAGAVGGRVLGASTLGGLVGAFATPHLLVPELGLAATYWIAAGLLVVAAALAAVEPLARSGLGARALLLALGGASAGFPPAAPGLAPGWVELARADSPYQRVRVVEDRSGATPLRYLQVNEGLDSFQSVWSPNPGLLGEGFYYDAFALPPAWSGATEHWRLCVLGLGAGTAFRVLDGTLAPTCRLEACGVEIDPVVVELGEAWFDLAAGPERTVLEGLDARAALAALTGPWDEIVLDAYANQVEIPAHLSTVEFFELAHAKLARGGWLAVNVGAFGCDDPLVIAVAETMAAAFRSSVLALRIPASRNVVLFARRDEALVLPGEPAWRVPALDVHGLLAKATHPANARVFTPPERAPLTDDRNPIDRLQLDSLELGRAPLASLR